MKMNNGIISYNENGHRPINKSISFEKKIEETAHEIRSTYGLPLIIMFQEVLAGRNMKFLNLLRVLYPEYELILPAGFDYVKHYKSIMSITLVRRDALGSYTVHELDSELPNRTCYLTADLNGIETIIINAHIVQVQNFRYQADWYIAERKRLHSQQWDLLHDVLHKNRNSNLIFGGDMQERRTAPNLTKIIEDGYLVSGASGAKTVRNGFFGAESCIDHIIFSPSQRTTLGDTTEIIYDNSGVGTYSDHTLLYVCS